MADSEGLRRRGKSLKDIKTCSVATAEVEEEPLSPAARLFHQPNFNVYVVAELGIGTRIDPRMVMERIVDTPLLKHPRFTSLQVLDPVTGDMKWVPTTINLSNHIIVPSVDPIAIPSPENFIENYIASLASVATDFSKPLWDLHILNLPTKGAEAVGIFRIHHSLGDGMSLMSLLLAGFRKTSDPTALPTVPAARPRPKVHDPFFLARAWSGIRLVWNTMVDVAMFLATVIFLRDTDTCLKGVPVPGKARWRFVHRTLGLEDVKVVKNKIKGTTINDVLMGITLAALTRYLNRKHGEKRKAEGLEVKENNLPKNIRLTASLLINTRPSPGIHALAEMMDKGGTEAKWGNYVGYALLPFPIGIRKDPLDYVRVAKSVIDRKKHSLEAIATCYMADIIFKLFGVKVASSIFQRAPESTTMSFSNVVGPVEEIGFCGLPLTHIAPGCFGQPNALMINWQSYVNKMTFVLSVDENTIPDSYDMCEDIEESLKLIKAAAIATR